MDLHRSSIMRVISLKWTPGSIKTVYDTTVITLWRRLSIIDISMTYLLSGRCVTLILFVALTILYAAYSANIVVLLRAPSSSVRSLPDLLNSPLKLGASDFEYNRYFFKVRLLIYAYTSLLIRHSSLWTFTKKLRNKKYWV